MIIYKILLPGVYITSEANPLEGTETFFDPNQLSEDGSTHLLMTKWSFDGKYMAYQISRKGSDWTEIYLRDAKTGEDMKHDHLLWTCHSGIAWT